MHIDANYILLNFPIFGFLREKALENFFEQKTTTAINACTLKNSEYSAYFMQNSMYFQLFTTY